MVRQKDAGRLTAATEISLRIDRNVTHSSLDVPADGVRQDAEIGMRGLEISREEWESQYADLRGPGCWPEQRNHRYKLKVKAQRVGRRMLALGALLGLLCWSFVYIDCGEHGEWGVGSCTCTGDFVGDRCQLASAYIISGAGDASFNGRYEWLEAECNG